MTLSVAACFPWGFRKQLRNSTLQAGISVPTDNPPAVILATDSRFSFERGMPQDDGKKLYPLCGNAAMVIAGDVLVAQRAERTLRRYFERRNPKSTSDGPQEIAGIMRAAFAEELSRAELGKRDRLGAFGALVGIYEPAGYCTAVRITSRSGFSPIYLSGVEAIGMPSDIALFRTALENTEVSARKRGSFSLDPNEGCLELASAFLSVLESPNRSSTVGGQIQMASLSEAGLQVLPIAVMPSGQTMSTGKWQNITADLDQVKRFRSGNAPAAEDGLVEARIAN